MLLVRSLSLPLGRSLETSGLRALRHAELQVVMDVRTAEGSWILGSAVRTILDGGCFQPLRDYRGVLNGGYEVRCVRAVSPRGDGVIRLILPDAHNRLDLEKMNPRSRLQHLGRFPDSGDLPVVPLPPPEEPPVMLTTDPRDIQALAGRGAGLFGTGCIYWPENDSDYGHWLTVGTPLRRRGLVDTGRGPVGLGGVYLGFAGGRPAVGVRTGRPPRRFRRIELFADCVVMRLNWEVDFAALPEEGFPYWRNRQPFWD